MNSPFDQLSYATTQLWGAPLKAIFWPRGGGNRGPLPMYFKIRDIKSLLHFFWFGFLPICFGCFWIFFVFVTHISLQLSNVQELKITELNNFNILMVVLRLANFWPSQYDDIRLEGLTSWRFDDSSIPVEQFDWFSHVERLHIASYWWTRQLKWLFITTYKWQYRFTGLQYLLEYHTLVLFVTNSIFNVNLRQQTSQDLNPDLQDQERPFSYTPFDQKKIVCPLLLK